jgi:Na+/H+-dicarboxylate symporter
MFSFHLQNSIRGLLDALLLVTGSFAAVWLLLSGVVAQPAAPSPLLMPTSSLAPTPNPTPTATPFQVLMDQAPFWNSALGIFLVIVIAIVAGLVVGLMARENGMNGLVGKLLNLFNDFTDVLAYWVVILAFVGIFILSGKVLKAAAPKGALESAKYVFAAVLPLLGTWIGTVLARAGIGGKKR